MGFPLRVRSPSSKDLICSPTPRLIYRSLNNRNIQSCTVSLSDSSFRKETQAHICKQIKKSIKEGHTNLRSVKKAPQKPIIKGERDCKIKEYEYQRFSWKNHSCSGISILENSEPMTMHKSRKARVSTQQSGTNCSLYPQAST